MNFYNNLAKNVPPPYSKMAVGQRVNTVYGVGIITDVRGTLHRGNGSSSNWDPVIATILVPGNPPQVFQQSYQTLIFTDSSVGGQVSTKNGLSQ